jgi:hypothetical protein
MRTCKIGVSKDEISNFPVNEMQVDPYWNDLYNPANYKRS